MKRAIMLETDYLLHTLFYRASIYGRNQYLARKHRRKIQYYGSLLRYSPEEINRHIEENRRAALNTRRRKKKAGMKYSPLYEAENHPVNL